MASRRSSYRTWTRLRLLRHSRKLTLRELATAIGYSYPHIAQIEQGRARPSDVCLYRIADLFEVDAADLLRSLPQVPPRNRARRVRRPEPEVEQAVA